MMKQFLSMMKQKYYIFMIPSYKMNFFRHSRLIKGKEQIITNGDCGIRQKSVTLQRNSIGTF